MNSISREGLSQTRVNLIIYGLKDSLVKSSYSVIINIKMMNLNNVFIFPLFKLGWTCFGAWCYCSKKSISLCLIQHETQCVPVWLFLRSWHTLIMNCSRKPFNLCLQHMTYNRGYFFIHKILWTYSWIAQDRHSIMLNTAWDTPLWLFPCS